MENEKVSMPLLGDDFPEMKVNTTHGELDLPKSYKGKWFILFSHPGDFTPVCTTEFIAFASRKQEFDAINTELIGLSVDQVFSHMKWAEWIGNNSKTKVNFPIIADELGTVSKKLGMLHEAKGTNTVRAVFIVDPKGKLRLTMYYPQEVGRSIDEILRSVKALQTSDEHGVATPENYPNNDWIGKDNVIIPPAASEEEKIQRLENAEKEGYTCKDWWFCHKKLN